MKPLWIILYLMFCVAAGAAGDAWNHIGMGTIGHACEILEILLCLIGAVLFDVKKWGPLVAWVTAYTCWRIVGFDYLHNLVTGQPIFHLDTISVWGRFLSHFPPHGVTFMRAVFLMVGIAVPIKHLK